MKESGYYPPGAEFDPRAPWNQTDPDEVEVDIDYSCTLRRSVTVATTDYIPGYVGIGEDGYPEHDPDDFSNTDWLNEFEAAYRTPQQLIALLREIATEFAEGRTPRKRNSTWQHIADDCENWEVVDENVEML